MIGGRTDGPRSAYHRQIHVSRAVAPACSSTRSSRMNVQSCPFAASHGCPRHPEQSQTAPESPTASSLQRPSPCRIPTVHRHLALMAWGLGDAVTRTHVHVVRFYLSLPLLVGPWRALTLTCTGAHVHLTTTPRVSCVHRRLGPLSRHLHLDRLKWVAAPRRR